VDPGGKKPFSSRTVKTRKVLEGARQLQSTVQASPDGLFGALGIPWEAASEKLSEPPKQTVVFVQIVSWLEKCI
jgi:hypothetical protein